MLALLGVLALPLLATPRNESERAGCFNNLRAIGLAARVWANDHDERFPWITPVTEGGTQPVPIGGKTAIAWTEFIALSNELSSPHVLVCPGDRAARVASHWGNSADGFANSGFRGNALSYILSYHSQSTLPRSVITADRDFRPAGFARASCSRGPVNVFTLYGISDPNVFWTNELHAAAGHFLFADGSVEFLGSARLALTLAGPGANDGNGLIHFINAR